MSKLYNPKEFDIFQQLYWEAFKLDGNPYLMQEGIVQERNKNRALIKTNVSTKEKE